MTDLLVSCIKLVPHHSPYEGITHLGGSTGVGGGWCWTREQVISGIEKHGKTFFTRALDGQRAEVLVVNGPTGKYVRTHADMEWTDDLLLLARCP